MAVQKYRKKPVVVDAMYWPTTGMYHDVIEIKRWVRDNGGECVADHTGFFIVTLVGRVEVMPGDYVIRGIAGDFYPCKPDMFERTYEAAS